MAEKNGGIAEHMFDHAKLALDDQSVVPSTTLLPKHVRWACEAVMVQSGGGGGGGGQRRGRQGPTRAPAAAPQGGGSGVSKGEIAAVEVRFHEALRVSFSPRLGSPLCWPAGGGRPLRCCRVNSTAALHSLSRLHPGHAAAGCEGDAARAAHTAGAAYGTTQTDRGTEVGADATD